MFLCSQCEFRYKLDSNLFFLYIYFPQTNQVKKYRCSLHLDKHPDQITPFNRSVSTPSKWDNNRIIQPNNVSTLNSLLLAMGKRHNKTSIGSSTNMKNEPPFKKKQFTPVQGNQGDMYDIPLKTVLDDLPSQVTPATMNDTTSLQTTADSAPHFDTALPRIHTVKSSDDEEILNDETALDISRITSDLDPELTFDETDSDVSKSLVICDISSAVSSFNISSSSDDSTMWILGSAVSK